MQTLLADPALLAGLAAIVLMVAYGVFRDVQRRHRGGDTPTDPVQQQYRNTAASLWLLCLTCLACWAISGRPLAEVGLQASQGWGGWLAWAIVAATIGYGMYALLATALDRKARCKLRRDFAMADGFDLIRPRTPGDHVGFQFLSLTAGITEEVIFRGFLIATLALVMPLWVAALVSIAVFILAHAYQGLSGMMRIAPITGLMTLVVVLGGSLWPAMIVHVLADALAGALVALVDTHEAADERMTAHDAAEADALPA